MNKTTLLLICLTSGLVMVAALVTAALLTGMPWLYILASWVLVLLLIIFLGFYFRAYRRVVTRIGTANERLSEIKFLQERRYEHLAQRLDVLSQNAFGESRKTTRPASNGQNTVTELSRLDYAIARIERAERRILGHLENLSLGIDTRLGEMRELLSDCAELKRPE